jgi:hypothetical protein
VRIRGNRPTTQNNVRKCANSLRIAGLNMSVFTCTASLQNGGALEEGVLLVSSHGVEWASGSSAKRISVDFISGSPFSTNCLVINSDYARRTRVAVQNCNRAKLTRRSCVSPTVHQD